MVVTGVKHGYYITFKGCYRGEQGCYMGLQGIAGLLQGLTRPPYPEESTLGLGGILRHLLLKRLAYASLMHQPQQLFSKIQ